MSLQLAADGLLVTMSRDELRTRAPELPPAPNEGWAGPRDGEKLGTWFGVSPSRTVACLLNAYRADEPVMPIPGAPSRGEIIPLLLGRGLLPEGMKLERYPSFTLLLASPGGATVYRWWKGVGLTSRNLDIGWHSLNSSAWPGAEGWREQLFETWVEEGCAFHGELPDYHLLQVPGKEHISPLMSRPEAGTRSITQARVGVSGPALIRYWASPSPQGGTPDCQLQVEQDP